MRWLYLLAVLLAWQGEKVVRSDSEWKELLGPERYHVMRKKGTEHAFIGKYVYAETKGIYSCAACALPLFLSEDKYDAGSGWPCFAKPAVPKNVYYLEDWRPPFKRYEILCSRCDSHLGHVFNDGPPPKNLRFTVNSISLQFNPQ